MPSSGIIRIVAAAISTAALSATALVSSADAQCGQEYRGAPAHSSVPGGPPLAIGDSVLADAVPELVRYGFQADGMVCRQMSQGIAILRERAARLPHLVVLALGANGEVTTGEIEAALAILGPSRVLVLVTPHGGVLPSTPDVVRNAAAAHPDRILLLDWDKLAAQHPDWLAPDGVHLGGAAGIDGFAQMVATVLPYATSAKAEPQRSGDELAAPETLEPPAAHRQAARPKRQHRAAPREATRSSKVPASPPAAVSPSSTALVGRTADHSSASLSPVLLAALAAAVLLSAAAAALWVRRRRG